MRKPPFVTTPTETSSDYLPIIHSAGAVQNREVQPGGYGVEPSAGQRDGSQHVPEPGARGHFKRRGASTMGRPNGGSGTPNREQYVGRENGRGVQ